MKPGDFAEFFSALYGRDKSPFPWQLALLESVATHGRWPGALDLPTSAGKTATIDIALYHLALEAPGESGTPAKDRASAMRIFFVVDRRIVVDEAFARALHIARKLAEGLQGGNGILAEVARRLLRFGGEQPLHVAMMRGGTYRDAGWARSPVQPTICVSTVDQVGSRLLFRGYGLSEFARPIHAGLIGCDSLMLVDEAHLSEPFLQTLDAVRFFSSENWVQQRLTAPLSVVRMSATTQSEAQPIRISDADRKHPVLRKRLEAKKKARLEVVPTEKDDEPLNQRRFRDAMADEALKLAGLIQVATMVTPRGRKRPSAGSEPEDRTVRLVGIVVNRVATARQVFERLRDREDCHAILLTGRTRSFDRDELLYRAEVDGRRGGWFRYCRVGREDVLDKPLLVVATQTIEVGANLDFDALVTEVAPLDALRQRFGRLDRLGDRGQSHAVILARKDAVARSANDPIYGTAVVNTWNWLTRLSGKAKSLDLGLAALEPFLQRLSPDELTALCTPRSRAPVMMPAHVDHWCQTSPVPAHDPDVAVFLHGPQTEPPDVQLVWRADLLREDEQELRRDPEAQRRYVDTVSLTPPSSMEVLSIPLHAARAWLQRKHADVTDVEGLGSTGYEDNPHEHDVSGRVALRWRGVETSEVVTADQIRPGDTLIVPCSYGGLEGFGWNPKSATPVADVADACSLLANWRPRLRLDPRVVRFWQMPAPEGEPDLVVTTKEVVVGADREECEPDFRKALEGIRDSARAPWWAHLAARELLAAGAAVDCAQYPHDATWSLTARRRLSREAVLASVSGETETAPHEEFSTEDDTSWLTRPCDPVVLERHCQAVRQTIRGFCRALSLDHMADDLSLAGLFHDVGKADPRFQVLLYGGDEIAALAGPLLAKSQLIPDRSVSIRAALERAQLPPGFRHELVSVVLAEAAQPGLGSARDSELVRYLIGVHHGRGRPLLPVIHDNEPPGIETFQLDGRDLAICEQDRKRSSLHRIGDAWPDLFWQLIERYGYWGLAFLEGLVRLADWQQSQREREEVLMQESTNA